MLKYVFDQEQLEGFNNIIGDKNDISILNYFETKELSDEDKSFFTEQGLINSEGKIKDEVKEDIELLAKPDSLVTFMFTGGAAKYEHTISHDTNKGKQISFTVTPDYFTIDDATEEQEVVDLIVDFVGNSSLKSVSLKERISVEEAFVLAAMIDMERRSILRAFVDELPYSRSRYGFNMIWRMVHSSNESIQWFVYCISQVVGEHVTLRQEQVKTVLDGLKEKELISEQDGQYQLSQELCQLANRMIIIDNVINVEAVGKNKEQEIINTGFTCMQSGIHDLLFIDYDGSEILLETISSELLLEYIGRFLKLEVFNSEN